MASTAATDGFNLDPRFDPVAVENFCTAILLENVLWISVF